MGRTISSLFANRSESSNSSSQIDPSPNRTQRFKSHDDVPETSHVRCPSCSLDVFQFQAHSLADNSCYWELYENMPWKGRPLPNSQIIPTVINGGIMALYFTLWGKGLLSCGPLIALLAEYAGAVLGVLSAALYGRQVHIWKKVGGLIAMLASYYFLSKGWATRTNSPFYSFGKEPLVQAKQSLGFKEMVVPISAGILSALRRVIARRVSLKNQLKRRLHAISIASATCFLFPLAMWDTILGSTSDSIVKFQLPSWAYLSTIFFGIIFVFYADNIAEERLHLVFSSPRHLMISGGSIILMEILHKMDFSLIGFVTCSLILGFGIFEATSLGRSRRADDLFS
ncbi:hypothetical protein OPV22_018226 [Ensete ventricosum]|uniref:EamA domain-containing protein n=1 Tax=Ensete ventricosum TaxID=4639 RepID=A0AAV8PFP3_ENSVE|nr:hypothetical protein OPV22_018226 [Ensete ventricosum]